MSTSEQRRRTFESFRKERGTVTPIHGHKEATTRPNLPEKNAPAFQARPGGKRWGYPLEFKMDFIRAVREQGMSIGAATRKFDICMSTANKWLDYYDLKRIPPKGSNEYPVNPQAEATPKPVTKTQGTSLTGSVAQASERKEQIRDAIDLLKQSIDLLKPAVDLLHTATRPKQPVQEPARHV